jgi:hypothetical protein
MACPIKIWASKTRRDCINPFHDLSCDGGCLPRCTCSTFAPTAPKYCSRHSHRLATRHYGTQLHHQQLPAAAPPPLANFLVFDKGQTGQSLLSSPCRYVCPRVQSDDSCLALSSLRIHPRHWYRRYMHTDGVGNRPQGSVDPSPACPR